MKKFGLPMWLPYPSSWLNALILSVFMTGLLAAIRRSGGGLYEYVVKWSGQPELYTGLLILLLILPIPALAFFHHLFLSRFIPAIPGERINKTQGFFPGLISWWESLYSWLVFVLSTLIAALICTPFLSLFNLNYAKLIYTYEQPQKNLQALFAIFWIVTAALLYQIEYLFKNRLVFADIAIFESKSINGETSVDARNEKRQPQGSVTEIQTPNQSSDKKPNAIDFVTKHRQVPKRIFILSLISVTTLWIYLFANLPEVRQTISTNVSSIEKQLASNSEPALKNDTFSRGIKKARYAATLTKSAQSENEWKIVASQWEEAIKFMEAVLPSSPNYGMAQQKILQYQVHREFAKQMLAGGF